MKTLLSEAKSVLLEEPLLRDLRPGLAKIAVLPDLFPLLKQARLIVDGHLRRLDEELGMAHTQGRVYRARAKERLRADLDADSLLFRSLQEEKRVQYFQDRRRGLFAVSNRLWRLESVLPKGPLTPSIEAEALEELRSQLGDAAVTGGEADDPDGLSGYELEQEDPAAEEARKDVLEMARLRDGLLKEIARGSGRVEHRENDRRVRILGGAYPVGAPATDRTANAHEGPAQAALLSEFWMARSPITVGEVVAFVQGGGYEDRSLWSEDGWAWRRQEGTPPKSTSEDVEGRGPDDVATHLNWFEAQALARFYQAQLPTEVQWEVAVGRFGPELHRSGGPHTEWCRDVYEPTLYLRVGRESDPEGRGEGALRVARGGSGGLLPAPARLTQRVVLKAGYRDSWTGVRLVRAEPPGP